MSKSTFNLNNFRETVLGYGLARTNRFEVLILPPSSLTAQYKAAAEVASLLVEQASFPILNIATKQFKIFGPTYQMPITSEYGGEGISINFHMDSNLTVKNFFDAWMHEVIDPTSYTVNYQEKYLGTIVISQLDEQDNITYEVELIDAFPRNINLMDLNNSSSNQTHRLNVLFAYRRWYATTPTDAIKDEPYKNFPEGPQGGTTNKK